MHAYNTSIWEAETKKSNNPIMFIVLGVLNHMTGSFCSTQNLWVGEDKFFKFQLLVAFVFLHWQLRPVTAVESTL